MWTWEYFRKELEMIRKIQKKKKIEKIFSEMQAELKAQMNRMSNAAEKQISDLEDRVMELTQ